MKKYKPGQFVSIGGKLARVSIANIAITSVSTVLYKEMENVIKLYIATGVWPLISLRVDVCKICKRESGNTSYCYHASECSKKLDYHLYPKFIKQCKKQEKL